MRSLAQAFSAPIAVVCLVVGVSAHADDAENKDDGKEKVEKAKEKAEETVESVKDTAKEAMHDLEAGYRKWVEEVINKGNFDAVGDYIAKNYIEHDRDIPNAPEDPIERFKHMMGMYRTAFPDMKATIEQIVTDDDKLAARIRVTGTNTGEFMGSPATGKNISMAFHDYIRYENGKAVEHWSVGDEVGMMEQLGMMPMPEGRVIRIVEPADAPEIETDGESDPQAVERAVRRFMEEAFNNKDRKILEEVLAEDFITHNPANPPDLQRGVPGVWEMVEMYHGAFEGAKVKIDDLIVDGNRAVARWTGSGKHTGEFMGTAPTNKPIEILGISFFRIQDGKIQEEWELFDQMGMMMQLGLITDQPMNEPK